ncbi:MAG: RHS repeat-associated core domain-containing protein, partial [Bacteroides sp.]|nr:RHS repeat-associated core domain-containing protein [Bacteroides sp.]
ENGSLKRILFDGGYIEGGVYHFYLTDYLGNVSTVADATGNLVQQNRYYPFGLPTAETGNSEQDKQPYKYNGKELDRTNGLNWYDYGARMYDPALCRFLTMDPLAEKRYPFSPYTYASCNPVNRVDPNGMLDDWVRNKETDEYVWMDNVTSENDTPEGYWYVGSNDEDILKDLNLITEFDSQTSVNKGFGVDGDEGVVLIMGSNVVTKSSLFVSADISQKQENVSPNNVNGKTFEGVTFTTNVSQTAMGANADYSSLPQGHFTVGYGTMHSAPLLHPQKPVVYQQGMTPKTASIHFSAGSINRNKYFSTAAIKMGTTNANLLYTKPVNIEWNLMRNLLFVSK